MKKTGALVVVIVAVVLVAVWTQGWSDQTRPIDRPEEKQPPKCPTTRYINCMPPVKDKAMCDPEYLRWVKEHCPDVEVVY